MKAIYGTAIIGLLSFADLFSQALPLDSVLARIERNNPALTSYISKIGSANELVNGAKAWMPPMAGTQLGENPYALHFDTHPYQLVLFAEQQIPNGKKLNAQKEYLKSFPVIKENEHAYWRNQFFARAKEKYYERYITEKKIAVLKDNIELMQNMISIAEKQLATGMGDLGSIYKMKARLAEGQTMLIHEENMVRSLTVELNYLMNADLNQVFALDTPGLVKDYRKLQLFAVKNVLENRSDIRKMNSEISSMKLNKALMASQSRPDYSLRYEHMSVLNGYDMYAFMFSMTIPVVSWSSKGYKSEVKSMDLSIRAMEDDRQAMLNMADQMVNMLILEMISEYAEVDNYRNNVIPAYKKSFDASLLAYSQNTGELMNAILAWDDLQMSQMEYLEHLGVLLKVQADYEREMEVR